MMRKSTTESAMRTDTLTPSIPHLSRFRSRCTNLLSIICLLGSWLLSGCATTLPAPVEDVTPGVVKTGAPIPAEVQALIDDWNAPSQAVTPFKVFDNLYYVGIKWVSAYVLETSAGLILIDSLYGPWIEPMLDNMRSLGLNPEDIRYVIATHGHFDHAGGAATIQRRYGATVIMTEEDWDLARQPAAVADFAFDVPASGQIAQDGEIIELGDTRLELFKTPGHTEGVLTLRYPVRDDAATHQAITLGGVGLNFSGVARTEAYLASYARIQNDLLRGVSVNLPNHPEMGAVFERAQTLASRRPGQPHPFVDEAALTQAIRVIISNAEAKLEQERTGNAPSPLDVLSNAVSSSQGH